MKFSARFPANRTSPEASFSNCESSSQPLPMMCATCRTVFTLRLSRNPGLPPALRALTEDFDRGEKMIATFSARNVPAAIPIQVATGFYRIAPEALRNVAKHAGRTHVRLTLKGTKGGLRLEVSDAGLGFDLSE